MKKGIIILQKEYTIQSCGMFYLQSIFSKACILQFHIKPNLIQSRHFIEKDFMYVSISQDYTSFYLLHLLNFYECFKVNTVGKRSISFIRKLYDLKMPMKANRAMSHQRNS